MNYAEIPVARLREVLSYDPASGLIRWIAKPSKFCSVKVGDEAGCPQKGPGSHRVIRVDGKLMLSHRIAWALHNGKWPSAELDHANRVPDDNRIGNLRECVNGIVNEQNTWAPRSHNSSGFPGVVRQKQCVSERWMARITYNGKQKHLGSYATREEAYAVYREAKLTLHPSAD